MGSSVFKNLSSAKAFSQNKWFKEGRYIVEISQCKFNEGGFKGDSFVIEAKVLASKSVNPQAPQPGETAAHVWSCSGEKLTIGRDTWMSFLCAMYGVAPGDYSDEQWLEISNQVLDDNALGEEVALLEVFDKKTKAGGDFTYHNWQRLATEADKEEFGL